MKNIIKSINIPKAKSNTIKTSNIKNVKFNLSFLKQLYFIKPCHDLHSQTLLLCRLWFVFAC